VLKKIGTAFARQPVCHEMIVTPPTVFCKSRKGVAQLVQSRAVPGLRLPGKRVAVLIEEGFSAGEVRLSRALLEAEGAAVVLVAPSIKAPYRDKTGTETLAADVPAAALRSSPFDAVVIPGGHSPDRIRMRHGLVEFVVEMAAAGKPIAAICHGPQVLITANLLRDRTVTCWPSIAVDVKNAGGRYVDRPAVQDGPIITGRKGDDVPAVVEVLIHALENGPGAI
jgi:protease I